MSVYNMEVRIWNWKEILNIFMANEAELKFLTDKIIRGLILMMMKICGGTFIDK